MRYRRYQEPSFEIVDGRVPMSDMENWIDELKSHPAFDNRELAKFFRTHVIRNVFQYRNEGLSEEECLTKILRDSQRGKSELTAVAVALIKDIIEIVYKRKTN